LWQWNTQSPGSSATDSKARIAPTGRMIDVCGQPALSGTEPRSVQVMEKW
jgi:hypothetical protein